MYPVSLREAAQILNVSSEEILRRVRTGELLSTQVTSSSGIGMGVVLPGDPPSQGTNDPMPVASGAVGPQFVDHQGAGTPPVVQPTLPTNGHASPDSNGSQLEDALIAAFQSQPPVNSNGNGANGQAAVFQSQVSHGPSQGEAGPVWPQDQAIQTPFKGSVQYAPPSPQFEQVKPQTPVGPVPNPTKFAQVPPQVQDGPATFNSRAAVPGAPLISEALPNLMASLRGKVEAEIAVRKQEIAARNREIQQLQEVVDSMGSFGQGSSGRVAQVPPQVPQTFHQEPPIDHQPSNRRVVIQEIGDTEEHEIEESKTPWWKFKLR